MSMNLYYMPAWSSFFNLICQVDEINKGLTLNSQISSYVRFGTKECGVRNLVCGVRKLVCGVRKYSMWGSEYESLTN